MHTEINPPSAGFAWQSSCCKNRPLSLTPTLAGGQAFRWRKDKDGIWWGTAGRHIFAFWKPEDNARSNLYWQTWPELNRREVVEDYLQLNVDTEALLEEWSRAAPDCAETLHRYEGARVLRQHPLECFTAFQCATCNTVMKIERSVEHLARGYGEIAEAAGRKFYLFPTLDVLAQMDEGYLRAGLWGYRAPRVIALAQYMRMKPFNWLELLRKLPYTEAKRELQKLNGIGPKVADCICLFALDKPEAVPVDTHVRKIAGRLFGEKYTLGSLTENKYNEIALLFHEKFGQYAGWAQQALFLAERERAAAGRLQ